MVGTKLIYAELVLFVVAAAAADAADVEVKSIVGSEFVGNPTGEGDGISEIFVLEVVSGVLFVDKVGVVVVVGDGLGSKFVLTGICCCKAVITDCAILSIPIGILELLLLLLLVFVL